MVHFPKEDFTVSNSPKSAGVLPHATDFGWQSPAELAMGRRKLTCLRNEEPPTNKTLKANTLLTPSFLCHSVADCNSTQICPFVFLNDY